MYKKKRSDAIYTSVGFHVYDHWHVSIVRQLSAL